MIKNSAIRLILYKIISTSARFFKNYVSKFINIVNVATISHYKRYLLFAAVPSEDKLSKLFSYLPTLGYIQHTILLCAKAHPLLCDTALGLAECVLRGGRKLAQRGVITLSTKNNLRENIVL